MRILIVDDEPLNRFMLKHMLEQQGYTDCYEAENGEQALDIAREIDPDLVLLDVMMPGLSGYEVAPRLKEMAGEAYLPIIFITSLEDQESLVRCLEVGGDDFASKPFDKVILAAKIRAHGRIRTLSKHVEQQNQELRFHQANVEHQHDIVEHIFSNAVVNRKDVEQYFDFKVSPAEDFNGDVFLCESSPKGGMYFLVGDFTGHGLASAIGALPVTRAFQAMARKGLSVAEMAITLNNALLNLLPTDMFFAAAIVEVSTEGNRFTIWNGGLPPMLLKSADGRLVRRFAPRHMALGILEENEFESHCDIYEAAEGEQLMAYSDGIMEITDSQGRMLDEEGVTEWFLAAKDVTAASLYDRALQYLEGEKPADDITVVIFTCQSLLRLRDESLISQFPFTVTSTLQPHALRQETVLEPLLEMLNSQSGLGWIRSDLFTVLTELMNNAIEHGLLKIDSSLKSSPEGFVEYYMKRESGLAELETGHITVSVEYKPHQRELYVSVEDSGDGFEYENIPDDDINNAFGRGIMLLRELCQTVWHENGGRKTCVTMTL